MARPKKNAPAAKSSAATVGYEAQLWQMADALRGSMDAAEYKHVARDALLSKPISGKLNISDIDAITAGAQP